MSFKKTFVISFLIAALLLATLTFAQGMRKHKTGGFTDERGSDSDSEAAVDAVRRDILEELRQKADKYSSVENILINTVSTQVVAGLNFRIKCTGADGDNNKIVDFQVVIFRSLPLGGDFSYSLSSLELNPTSEEGGEPELAQQQGDNDEN